MYKLWVEHEMMGIVYLVLLPEDVRSMDRNVGNGK
jgi:hypothetical protein